MLSWTLKLRTRTTALFRGEKRQHHDNNERNPAMTYSGEYLDDDESINLELAKPMTRADLAYWRIRRPRYLHNRVPNPDECTRTGTYLTGGHCLMCGIDLPPYRGMGVDWDTIICTSHKCYEAYYNHISRRGWCMYQPARHHSKFGDHACYTHWQWRQALSDEYRQAQLDWTW